MAIACFSDKGVPCARAGRMARRCSWPVCQAATELYLGTIWELQLHRLAQKQKVLKEQRTPTFILLKYQPLPDCKDLPTKWKCHWKKGLAEGRRATHTVDTGNKPFLLSWVNEPCIHLALNTFCGSPLLRRRPRLFLHLLRSAHLQTHCCSCSAVRLLWLSPSQRVLLAGRALPQSEPNRLPLCTWFQLAGVLQAGERNICSKAQNERE